MNRQIRALVVALAVAATPLPSIVLAQPADLPAPVVADRQATIDIPIGRIVLYSSGVGYFEHDGNVTGDATTELRFKTDQINDILKSLLLQDSKGVVSLITYPSQEPLDKQLKSFRIDVAGNPSLADLLKQLRGSQVIIQHATDGKLQGTILSVETQPRAAGKEAPVIPTPVLSLVTDDGLRTVDLPDVRSIVLKDPDLQKELSAALAALAQARNQDKKPVTIRFQGDGERRVRIGYVVESPVWKTSYRLMLSDEKPEVAGLQGWAIVENQTDTDWNNVRLSLVSGRPISFVMDLYQPLYIPRPMVQPELYTSLRPQEYAQSNQQSRVRELGKDRSERRLAAPSAAPAPAGAYAEKAAMDAPMDAESSIEAAASGAAVGELFEYAIQSPVTLARQKTAMIPIITDDIAVQRLSIYKPTVLPRNPLNGARLKNTSGKHLLTGPITVLLNGTYAGDATIGSIPPGQERLISYGIDQRMLVDTSDKGTATTIQTGKIVKGVLELTTQSIATTRYDASNKGDKDKTLLIEHPIRPGWDLVQPDKPTEKTDAVYRFEITVGAGKSADLTVKQRIISAQSIALLDLDDSRMIALSRNGEIPQVVRDALSRAIELKQQLSDTQAQAKHTEQALNAVQQDQARIRENITRIDRNSKFYTQQMEKMADLENSIESHQSTLASQREQAETQRQALEQYLAGLNVG